MCSKDRSLDVVIWMQAVILDAAPAMKLATDVKEGSGVCSENRTCPSLHVNFQSRSQRCTIEVGPRPVYTKDEAPYNA
jgi:hypothetical protein